jgi:hypothetical protein
MLRYPRYYHADNIIYHELIYDFATAPLGISLYMRKNLILFFLCTYSSRYHPLKFILTAII